MHIIAINGGGTRTEAVLLDETGTVLRKEEGEASSATALHVTHSIDHLNELLMKLTKGISEKTACVWAGISGVTENREKHDVVEGFLTGFFGNETRIFISTDTVNAFRSVVYDGEGIVANVSTGSSVFSVNKENGIRQIGGWGYLLGDEGSAYDLGRRALVSVLRQYDGRGGKTLMTEMIREQTGKPINELIPEVYRGGRNEIARYAGCLLDAAGRNDRVALHNLDEAAAGIADAIKTAGNDLGCSLMRVALSGSMWENRIYYDNVDHYVGRNYQMLLPQYTKLTGAAIMALREAGTRVDKAMIEKLGNNIGFIK